MQKIMRFSLSGLVGMGITAGLFVGMLKLLDGEKPMFGGDATDIRFSFVKAFEPIKQEENIRPDKPEPQEVSQAPTVPQMPTMASDEFADLGLPDNPAINARPNLVAELGVPSMGEPGGQGGDRSGTIKTAIAPMYPQKPLLSKTEGWVKLLIQVNEFGKVSSATVLDAEPARVFNAAALKAIKKWTFYQKVQDGQAMPFQVTQTIEFKLDQ
ncbi:energy transducer TonB [Marinicella sediminis]|uniref:Protein TonB n=1 Tax=Marinicella sediminis TaxID=1792834 RepID=A0ABV7J3S2_9GAMM|nr:energy transducer TonB [Marinicella sediminis]